MKIERGETTNIQVSNDTHVVGVDTTITETRRTLSFNYADAIREKENRMYRELGKSAVLGLGFAGAAVQGLEQIVNGFAKADMGEMGRGAEIVLLASFLLPLANHFWEEAKIARRARNKIKQASKSSK